MKRPTRNYNLRSLSTRQTKKEGARSEVDDTVTHRVCKKIAKTIYKKGRESKIPSKVCTLVAEKIEELVLEASANLEEYKARIVVLVQKLSSEGAVLTELTELIGSGEIEEWARQLASVANQ